MPLSERSSNDGNDHDRTPCWPFLLFDDDEALERRRQQRPRSDSDLCISVTGGRAGCLKPKTSSERQTGAVLSLVLPNETDRARLCCMYQRRSSSLSPSTLESLGSVDTANEMRSSSPQGMASVPSGAAGDEATDSVAAKSLAALSESMDKQGGGGMNTFKIVLLVLMVLQNSATVLVGRYTRASVEKVDLYSVNHLIVVVELGKLILSAALELQGTRFRLVESIRLHNFQRPLDALKIVVPALLYLVQNTLLYVALSNLTAPIFQVTYQCKLVTTALVSVLMLQRSYSVQQWICLVVLSVGVAVVVLDSDTKKSGASSSKTEQSLFVGLVAVSIACMSSALAGVYFEKVLKKPEKEVATPASLWMRNMQLAFFSVVIALGQGVYEGNKDGVGKPYLHGFTLWVWVLVALQAGGGLLVAAVIKYADNVLKGLATGVSVVFATALSTILFKTPLSTQFSLGAVLILMSVYVFSNPVNLAGRSKSKQETEMKSLLPK